MRLVILSALGGLAAIAATPAWAANTVTRCDSNSTSINTATSCNIVFDGLSGNYGNPNVNTSPFVDIYQFDLSAAGVLGLTLQSIGSTPNADISFSLVRLNPPGQGGDQRLTQGSTGTTEFYSLSNYAAAAGTYNLRIAGSVVGSNPNAAYSGTLSFSPGAVPEPASWAMMILGVGAIGFAMRRRKVATTVKFA